MIIVLAHGIRERVRAAATAAQSMIFCALIARGSGDVGVSVVVAVSVDVVVVVVDSSAHGGNITTIIVFDGQRKHGRESEIKWHIHQRIMLPIKSIALLGCVTSHDP